MDIRLSGMAHFSDRVRMKKILLVCGIFSSLFYVAINIFVPLQDPQYSWTSQAVSELSAIGAATRQSWVAWSFLYTFLVMAFGYGVWLSGAGVRSIRIVGVLILIYGSLGFGWPFVPMHTREVLASGGSTSSDTWHIIFSLVTIVIMMFVIGFGCASQGKLFRFYSILTIFLFILFGNLTWLEAGNMEANLATPMLGIWERINIGLFLIWVVVFASVLLYKNDQPKAIEKSVK